VSLTSGLQTVCGRIDCSTAGTGASCATADGTSCGMTNASLFERASKVLVGGVNSPVRAFRSVGGTPYFVARAQGAHVWDIEGNQYLDYVQSYGASILGHADPEVVATIQQAATQGTTFGAPTYREVLMAEAIAARVPGIEMVRMCSSGTEATMSAIRLARGITGRNKVIKFSGCYHGASDSLLAEGGSGVANQSLSGSDGVPPSAIADTIVWPWNVVPEIGPDVAVVAVEPIAANMGLVPPNAGYLQALRDACTAAGALLLFDEVITGFRIGAGGATVWSGVVPDIWCFGKIIGGGLPVGAIAGTRAVMENFAPIGKVYQGGTLSGNPLATAAGLAVLERCTPDAYAALTTMAQRLGDGLREAINGAGLPAQVPVTGTLVGIHLTGEPVTNYDDAKRANQAGLYPKFFHEMLSRGIAMAPGAYEALFPSFAHTNADIDRTITAAAESAAAVAATL
jgi:glutamate-1-semialdehyde 2,1-aminomutase